MAVMSAGVAPAFANQAFPDENEAKTPFMQPIIMKGHGKSSERTVLLAQPEGKVESLESSPVIKHLAPTKLPASALR